MNKTLLALILTIILVQIIKVIILYIKEKEFQIKHFIKTGGMPSSHSALVTSLVTIIYLIEGFSSTFTIALVLALIVMRDAFGVRRTVGEETQIIKKLLKKNRIKTKLHNSEGHTPYQVTIGAIIGLLITLIIFFF
ncbi:MAG: divergent PAP2 family protein [Nanoarchaeota archaeon]|nr:divergent PAP2 family protein [Nanoarchaeota archaeon]